MTLHRSQRPVGRRRMLAALALAGAAPWVRAQAWPTRPVRIVHAYPGGPLDAAMRFLAERLSAAWGQPVLVDPKPGANEIIAADAVAKSAPDGTTLFMGTEATFANNAFLYARLPFDPVRDLLPVTELFGINYGLITRGDLAPNSVAEFVALMKREGANHKYASVGVGSGPQLAMENFKRVAGIELLHVPYRTTPQAIQDLVGGQVDAVFGTVQIALPFLAARKMKLLAMTGAGRQKVAPDVPTFAEIGLPGVDYRSSIGMAVPRGTPADVVQRIEAGFRQVLNARDTQERITEPNGYEVVASDSAGFAQALAARRVAAQRLIRELNLRLE